MKRTALIMAGGRGERFWPKSRRNLPKQFLSLTDDGKTMIQLTVERVLPLVDLEDIFIVTNKAYRNLVMEQLPNLPVTNILCEPLGRNTAPCIGLGAIYIEKKYKDAIMLVLPSDHLIQIPEEFLKTLKKACNAAEKNYNLVTIGITPNYPETGYGYIKFDCQRKEGDVFFVDKFVEKPDIETAKQYISSGQYLWNSGMFVWKVSSILEGFRTYMQDTYEKLLKIQLCIGTKKEYETLENIFPHFKSESIDYGIMEKSKDIYILTGCFGWDDVGSWLAVERIRNNDSEGNTIRGNVLSLDNNSCIIEASGKLIAAIGLKDIVVVDTEDVTLICDKYRTGDIKQALLLLGKNDKNQYL